MPTIENIAAVDFQHGFHTASGDNTIAIQIIDPCGWVPIPKKSFAEIHKFEFLDTTNPDDSIYGEFCITAEQAFALCDILRKALIANMNVVVHCTAGICRSGAVVEVATMVGFEAIHNNRIPNTLVKKRMMKFFGLTYDSEVTMDSGVDVTKEMEDMVWEQHGNKSSMQILQNLGPKC